MVVMALTDNEVERIDGHVQVLEELIDEALGLIRRHGASPIAPLEQAEALIGSFTWPASWCP